MAGTFYDNSHDRPKEQTSMVDYTGPDASYSHVVELGPNENLFDAWRRWDATAPAGHCGPVYIH